MQFGVLPLESNSNCCTILFQEALVSGMVVLTIDAAFLYVSVVGVKKSDFLAHYCALQFLE
jgi:hypothetical protein